MQQRLTPSTVALLTLPPMMWAGNAVVGRMVSGMVPPITLNFFRWVLAFLLLLPLGGWVLRPASGLWSHWRRFALLGLLGVGCYNALQYLALQTSSPLNVTLMASSIPVWMLGIGWLWFGQEVTHRQLIGIVLSVAGVVLVLCRGKWALVMQFRLVPGDLYMLAAAFAWALYSWLLTRSREPADWRDNWSAFLLAQVTMGLFWSGMFAAGEWAVTNAHIVWGWRLAAALLYVGAGPAVLAYCCWGLGVQRVGPNIAGFFSNLAPLFAALMSAAFLGERPQLYHAIAFVLIVGGIVVASRR
jgi:drug/metabolite transporter (DMT)-like permease